MQQLGRASMMHTTHSGEPGEQFDLFAGFGLPVREAPPKARRRACTLRRVASKVIQLTLDLKARAEDATEEWVDRWVSRPVVHAIVEAKNTRMPETRAVASIFDMGYQLAAQKVLDGLMLAQPEADTPRGRPAVFQEQAHLDVSREAGVVRVKRLHHTDTQEWQEREAARRARQKPPKPPKKAKTMSAKLVELVGVTDGA
jgi:hypothetical protein